MIFEHYRNAPILFEEGRQYQQKVAPFGKPMGLWISVAGEDDWPAWCHSEEFAPERLIARHRLDLDLSRILVLSTPGEIDDFDTRYGREIESR